MSGGDGDPITPAAPHAEQGSSTRVLHLREFGAPMGESAAPSEAPRSPTTIGPYRILRQLGRGGMGSVFLAEPCASCPVPMGRLVAVKVLHRADAEERRRFEREAAYLQSLRHPGIVRVLDAGEHEGQPFLVMQLIEGKRLDDLVIKGPLPEREAAELVSQSLEALHVAHLAGILHRDIKPGNIMVDQAGVVRLLDFGLASQMHLESRLTRTGNVVGTPAYMSPEQASGARDSVSRRSDIYGMGACLYELLTAMQPYTADNSVAVLRRIIDDPLVPPGRLRPGLSRELETIVLVSMAKDPRDRYATAEAMASDLRRWLDGERVRARRVSPLTLGLRTAWRHRRPIAGASLAVFLVLSAGALSLARWVKVQRAQQEAARRALEPPPDSWTVERRIDGALDAPGSGVAVAPHPQLGKGMALATLPGIPGPVRLAVTVERIAGASRVELLVNDRDVGRGYRVRLEADDAGTRLTLMREDTVVKSRSLPALAVGQPWRLAIERVDDQITARLADEPPLRHDDLVPIEGSDASATYVAFTSGAASVRQAQLERRARGLLVSGLTPGDVHRQDGRYARAIREYQAFLHDQPDSPMARDAKFRIALCEEAMGGDSLELAYAHFIDLAAAEKAVPRYALAARFHAWSCALRTGRYEQAEQLFAEVRRDYDLETLLALIPEDMLTKLLHDYLDRAERLAGGEPQRAHTLYAAASDLAGYLKMGPQVSQARAGAGDVLVALGRLEEAKGLYYAASIDQASPIEWRLKAQLKIAEVERLMDHGDAAEAAYRAVMDSPLGGDLAQWARLWLGDLHLQRGAREEALVVWGGSTGAARGPGEIMQRLVGQGAPLTASDDRFFANDVAYFNGCLRLLASDQEGFREALQTVARIGPPYDWPTPLAKHLLLQADAGARSPAPSAPAAP